MVFNNEVLFLHLGKTGGMSVVKYLCNVLKPPVYSTIPEEAFNTGEYKKRGHEILLPFHPHANLPEASEYLKKHHNLSIDDFKVIIVAIREPVDLQYSYYNHLQKPKVIQRLSKNPANQKLLEASQGNFNDFVLQGFTHPYGDLKDFVEIDGKVPSNIKIVRSENLATDIPKIVQAYANKTMEFPRGKNSNRGALPELSPQAKDKIRKMYGWVYKQNQVIAENSIKSNTRKKYLFVGGVGRSGTSVLTGIVNSHNKIVLAVERYNKVLNPRSFSLAQDHFKKENFFSVKEGETFYHDFSHFKNHEGLIEKWDAASYVGVKFPQIAQVYEQVEQVLGEIHLIYIFRNIFDVAESWNRRAKENSKWPENRNAYACVDFWNRSLAVTRKLIKQNKNIICVNYEDLLFSNKPVDPIFDFLGLEVEEGLRIMMSNKRKLAMQIRKRKKQLSPEEISFIEKNARFDLYEEFNTKYNILA